MQQGSERDNTMQAAVANKAARALLQSVEQARAAVACVAGSVFRAALVVLTPALLTGSLPRPRHAARAGRGWARPAGV